MMIEYRGATSDELTYKKKYVVFAYEIHKDKSKHYWVMNDQNKEINIMNDNILLIIDDKHSDYWKKTVVDNNIFYFPNEWFKNIHESYYDKTTGTIHRIWEWRFDISENRYDLYRNKYFYHNYLNRNEVHYLNEIFDEYPSFFYECNQETLNYTAKAIDIGWVYCADKVCDEIFETNKEHCIAYCPKCFMKQYNPYYNTVLV